MSIHDRDKLDSAIDQVAGRMVAVSDDPEMVARIVSALPERSLRLGWLLPQVAALSALVIAALVWSTRERPASPAVLPSTQIAAATVFRGGITPRVPGTPREPGTAVRTEPLAPWNPGTLEPDFDRSLPALMVTELPPVELPASPALELAPIGVTDLPLTAESFPPR